MSNEFSGTQGHDRLLAQLGNPSFMIAYPQGVDGTFDAMYSKPGIRGTLAEVNHDLMSDFIASQLGCLVFQTRKPSGEVQQYYVGEGLLVSPTKRIDGATLFLSRRLTEVPDSMTREFVVGEAWPFGSDSSEKLESIARPWSYGVQSDISGFRQGVNSPTQYGYQIVQQHSQIQRD